MSFRKIIKAGPNRLTYAILLTVLLAAGLVPVILLTRYTIPFFDDYGYALPVWLDYKWGGFHLKGAVAGAVRNAVRMWHTWQGTYASITFMGLNPFIFREDLYFLGPVFLIANLVASLFVFVGTVLKKLFKADFATILGMQSGITFLIVLFIHSAQQGFYWYNGGIHYVGMFSFELYYLSLMMALLWRNKENPAEGKENKASGEDRGKSLNETNSETAGKTGVSADGKKNATPAGIVLTVCGIILSVVLAFVVAGANFVTTLQTPILLLSGIVLAILTKNRRVLAWIPSLISYGIGFYLNISAPGNAARAGLYPDTPSAAEAVLRSFPEALRFAAGFLDKRTALFLILLLPFIFALAKEVTGRNREKYFPLYGIAIFGIWSFCVYSATFTPGLYGTGAVDLARMVNVIKMTFQLLLVANEIYITVAVWCFVSGKKKSGKEIRLPDSVPWPAIVIWLGLFVMVFVTSPDRVGQFSSYGAAHYLADGEAKIFHSQYLVRLETLHSPETDPVFRPYSTRPWFLIWQDLGEDPGEQQNRELAEYYGKSSVRVGEP